MLSKFILAAIVGVTVIAIDKHSLAIINYLPEYYRRYAEFLALLVIVFLYIFSWQIFTKKS